MKYYQATVLVGFPDSDVFDSHCDLTFALAHELHNPSDFMWMIKHDEIQTDSAFAEKLKTQIFTKEGGI